MPETEYSEQDKSVSGMISDVNILLWLQDCVRCEGLDYLFLFITTLGNAGIVWIGLTLILLYRKDTRRTGYMSAAALISSVLINNLLLKNLVARIRPYEMIEGLTCLIGKQSDYSFPSGHSAASFAAAVIFFMTLPKKYGVSALILAILISFSRLYIGVHYPTDVLAGAVSGTVIALVVYYVGRKVTSASE